MEERAPGGELLLRPIEWLKWTMGQPTSGGVYIVHPHLHRRAKALPDRPMTRMEYLEEMAFVKEEQDGSV